MNWQKLFNTKKIPKKKRQKISQICLEQLEINVVQKSVKNLRLTVNAPKGEVRVSAPLRVSKEFIELFLGSKIDWIKEQQEKIRQQTLSSEKTYVAEEKHELLGKTYCLKLKDTASRTKVVLAGEDLLLFTRSDTPRLRKEKAMESFYKKELERIIPIYISIIWQRRAIAW